MQLETSSRSASVVGLDIGGANIKCADTSGTATSVEFPMWARPDELGARLTSQIDVFAKQSQVVATMTGELADCFLDRSVGITHIVDHLCSATRRLGMQEPLIYSVDGSFYHPRDALSRIDTVAASNWHALASYIAREFLPQGCDRGLVVDIGSTTTDLIPIRRGGVVAIKSQTDFQRLREGSLVYLGGTRTPVCSIVDRLEFRGESIPIMREVFATMGDVRLLLGYINEDSTNFDTADGKPADRFHATNRLARMIGLDHREFDYSIARQFAQQVHDRARSLVRNAFDSLIQAGFASESDLVILSGHADDLASEISDVCRTVRLTDRLGPAISRCAPSYAVANLFAETMTPK